MASFRARRHALWFGVPVVLLAALIAVWNWDWFIPLVETRVSASIGRKVTLQHLHVGLGRTITVAADGVEIANPPDWSMDVPPLADVGRLTIQVDVWDYLCGRGLVIPLIALERPRVYAAETAKGEANFRLDTGSGGGGNSPSPKIGDLRIDDGAAHVVMPRLHADFNAVIRTQGTGNDGRILIDAKGTYAAHPIQAHFAGGALLSLRDKEQPWPVELSVENGPTRVVLKGTLQDPLAFQGANVRLELSGPNMGLLQPLTGIPIPTTPPYRIAGALDLQGFSHIAFKDFQGRLGVSDIAGTITDEPETAAVNGKSRPIVTMDLRSNRVDLNDLAGFIGGTPGSTSETNLTPAERAEVARAAQSKSLLPNTPISVPRLTWADIHLRYQAGHIQGRNMPLDNLTAALDVVNGRITLHPLSFGVGKGRLIGNLDVTPENDKNLHAKMDLHMQNLDVSRMMAATHAFQGAGTVSGVGAIDATGNSVASLLGHGNGEIKMAMAGGDLSALLIDLTGLQFGNALLSALGIPQRTEVQCFVGDLALQQGVVDFRALTLDTKEAITNVTGDVNLGKEDIDLHLKTDAKHFSVGSLPTRINIGGTFKNPSIRPGAEVAARAGAAVGLGVLFVPLAILPTIQFGTSQQEDERCDAVLRQARQGAGGQALPMSQQRAGNEQ